jgi:hypothetical protein
MTIVQDFWSKERLHPGYILWEFIPDSWAPELPEFLEISFAPKTREATIVNVEESNYRNIIDVGNLINDDTKIKFRCNIYYRNEQSNYITNYQIKRDDLDISTLTQCFNPPTISFDSYRIPVGKNKFFTLYEKIVSSLYNNAHYIPNYNPFNVITALISEYDWILAKTVERVKDKESSYTKKVLVRDVLAEIKLLSQYNIPGSKVNI